MSRETVAAAVNAAEQLNATLNAFLYIDKDAPQRAEGAQGSLAGVPSRERLPIKN